MPEIDFVMTYPCYLLLTERENPETIIVDNEGCLCLFTDIHLVEQFYKGKYGDNFETRQIQTCTIPDRVALTKILRESQSELASQGCNSIAIDATPNRMVGYVAMDEFIAEITKEVEL